MSELIASKYSVGNVLGKGGYATVKLGRNEETGERVALKFIYKKALEASRAEMKQVVSEYNALGAIDHPNVLKLHEVSYDEVDSDNGKSALVLVLELAERGELFDFLSYTGKFSDTLARTYFHQIISGIEACHNEGIAHRDLKPENLLLDSNFMIKIADFGFARAFENEEGARVAMRTECGTQGYMAPEVLGRRGYDNSADIFSAGVILFIMIAGFPPFQFASRNDWWFHKLMSGKTRLFWRAHCRNATFTDDAKDFLERILAPDASNRITIEDMQEHAWFNGEIISEEDLTAQLEERLERMMTQKKRERNAAARGRGERVVDHTTDTKRSAADDEDDDEELPTGAPSLKALLNGGADRDVISSGSTFESGDSGMGSGFDADVPEYKADEHLMCYTSFRSSADGEELLEAVADSLKYAGMRYKRDAANFALKSQYTADEGSVEFEVRVYNDAENDTRIVRFNRMNGDVLFFNAIYDDILTEVVDLVDMGE
jgi:serine/threonine protein kinase